MNSIAVIGAGRWGRNLIHNFDQLGALGAVVDTHAQRRQQLVETYPQLPVLQHYHSLFANDDIRGVAIATPSATHVDIAVSCLERGLDVFVEKPMALDAQDAQRLAHVAAREERILMVGHLLLYQPAVHWVRNYLASGKLGRVRRFHHDRLGPTGARAGERGENVLWNLGVHDLAVSLYLVDKDPIALDARGQCGPLGLEEDVHVHLTYPEGVEAWLHCSWLWPERVRRTTVVGEYGVLVYDELAQSVTLYPGLADVPTGGTASLQGELVFRGHPEPVRLELEHFLARIADRHLPRSCGRHGKRVIGLVEDAMARIVG